MEEVRKVPERDGAGIVSVKEVIATDEKRSDLEYQVRISFFFFFFPSEIRAIFNYCQSLIFYFYIECFYMFNYILW